MKMLMLQWASRIEASKLRGLDLFQIAFTWKGEDEIECQRDNITIAGQQHEMCELIELIVSQLDATAVGRIQTALDDRREDIELTGLDEQSYSLH